MPSRGGWLRRQGEAKSLEVHTWGQLQEIPVSHQGQHSGKVPQRSLRKHPRLRRILKQKLHSRMEGGGSGAPVESSQRILRSVQTWKMPQE